MREAEGNGTEPVGGAEGLRQLTGGLHARLDRVEKLLEGGAVWAAARSERAAARTALPAWRRVTRGEQRWAVGISILIALAIQWALPSGLTFRPHWLLPLLEIVLLIGLVAVNPIRIERRSKSLRSTSLLLAALVSLANGWSAVALVRGLVAGSEGQDAGPLLMTGAGIWITNVIAFALWYWEWDRGGPAARAAGHSEFPDFLFPQMQDPHLAPSDWEPGFLDYLYMAFTNATAFSPTDVMPLSRWAKILMLTQSAVSLLTMVLVISRAVGILK